MKRAIPCTAAALLAAGGMSLAAAQTGKDVNPAPPVHFAQEPIATASTTQGAEGQMVASIVQALNADAALKHSKIAVQPVEGKIVMTGVTLTQAQKKEAIRVAASQAGETKIVDAMQSDDV